MKKRSNLPVVSLISSLFIVVILSSCSSAGDRIKIGEPLVGKNPLRSKLIDRVKEYYSYLENKDFGEIYDLMSNQLLMEHNKAQPKSEFIDYFKNDTILGKCKWKFASLELKVLIIEKNKAYVEMEYSMQEIDTFNRKYITYPKETWWDEWVFENGNWKLFSFCRSGYRPNSWPKD